MTRPRDLVLALCAAGALAAQAPVELGTVDWLRDRGAHVLSDPLLDEAAGTLFVPAAVRNNAKDGAGGAVRQAFDERADAEPKCRLRQTGFRHVPMTALREPAR